MGSDISVQVCFITPQLQFLRTLSVVPGTTIQQVVALSGILDEIPGIDINQLKVGIYSKIKNLDTVLKEHDRVEIYRPLQVDPMVARHRRANKK
ncbi:RnfH family protein [Solimicrobium silvestre]|nr:RnfH family protein [Solimicrobium silvestre]